MNEVEQRGRSVFKVSRNDVGRKCQSQIFAFGDRVGRLLFKLAVNDDMLTHVLAAGTEVDELAALDRLRVQCVNETKQTHGAVEFKDAYLFERGL